MRTTSLVPNTFTDLLWCPYLLLSGYCLVRWEWWQVLHEYAFETGNLFDTELVSDQTRLVQEVVDDFWRTVFYHAPPELISFALNKN